MNVVPVLSVRDLAKAILPDGCDEEINFISRRIRHWTLSGLLPTVGTPRSGVGNHRRYANDVVGLACVLNVLAGAGMSLDGLTDVVYHLMKNGLGTCGMAGAADSIVLQIAGTSMPLKMRRFNAS